MPPIDPTTINVNVPAAGEATTASVRANEAATKANFQAALDKDNEQDGRLDAIDLELAANTAAIGNNTSHRNATGNVHSVTAGDVGAEPVGAVDAHNNSGTAHAGQFELTGTVADHDVDPGAHSGTFEPLGTVPAHDQDSAAHGGVENKFATHDGSRGAAHDLATGSEAGFMSAAQFTALANALLKNVAATIAADIGYAGTPRTVTAPGTWTPDPKEGQFFRVQGSGTLTINAMLETGVLMGDVPDAVTIVFNAAYKQRGNRVAGEVNQLHISRVDTPFIAWG